MLRQAAGQVPNFLKPGTNANVARRRRRDPTQDQFFGGGRWSSRRW